MTVPADRQAPAKPVPAAPVPAASGGFRFWRILPLAVLVGVAVVIVAMGWHRAFSLESLVRHRDGIDAFVAENRAAALAAFGAIYVAAVALSLPGAVFLTISGGLLFGTLAGAAVTVVAATTGATILFLIARNAVGGWIVRRVGPLAERLAENFRRDAFSYILFLRLVPVFPFWIVNLVSALCGAGLRPFVAATAIGIIPATLAFAFLGSGLDSALEAQAAAYKACLAAGTGDCRLDFDLKAAATPELLGALAVLSLVALVPIFLKRLKRFQERPH